MITKTILEGETLPFGHMVVGFSINRYGYQTALFPFNYLIKWWRDKRSVTHFEKWETKLMKRVEGEFRKSYKRGYEDGKESIQQDLNRKYMEISALLNKD